METQLELYLVSAALRELAELSEEERPGLAYLLVQLADRVERAAGVVK